MFSWFSRHKILTGIAVSLLVGWYVVFEWPWMIYTDGGPTAQERCYSPNHEYYIVRYQSLIRALMPIAFEPAFGAAKLYDKSGNLLHAGQTLLGFQAGPNWGDVSTSRGKEYSVFFIGNSDDSEPRGGWVFSLPSSPGDSFSIPEKHCF